jgi:dienelactone hydrolase
MWISISRRAHVAGIRGPGYQSIRSAVDFDRHPLALSRLTAPIAVALIAMIGLGLGTWLLGGAAPGTSHRHVVVDGVPLDEVHPPGPATERRPGVVVAHGYAGSARLMAPFGDTLSSQGYVVVLLDFTGHGRNTRPLPDAASRDDEATAMLQHDLDVALTHLRELPDVDPARVALVGHSMGAGAVTRYAVAHPEITATAAISLPDSSMVTPQQPKRLLLLVGGLEFAGFRAVLEDTAGADDRRAVTVSGVEHISIMYAPRTHREIAAWLNESFHRSPPDGTLPSPLRRPLSAAVLLLSFLLGMYPLAQILFGNAPPRRPPATGPIAVVAGVAAVAAIVGMLVAPILPTSRLPLAIGSFVAGFTAATGIVLLAYQRWRGPVPAVGISRLRLAIATPVLIGYAALTIVVPLQLGLTQAVPVGVRWWFLVVVWAGFAVLAFASQRLTGGGTMGTLTVSAVVVIALVVAAAVGLTSSFVLLVVPLLAVLFVFQAIWSAVLQRFSCPPWLSAAVGSLIVALPIAVALPVIG